MRPKLSSGCRGVGEGAASLVKGLNEHRPTEALEPGSGSTVEKCFSPACACGCVSTCERAVPPRKGKCYLGITEQPGGGGEERPRTGGGDLVTHASDGETG